jgi:hypothetical protein
MPILTQQTFARNYKNPQKKINTFSAEGVWGRSESPQEKKDHPFG